MGPRGKGVTARELWEAKADEITAEVAEHMRDVKVLLLGPGYPPGQLEIRKDAAERLRCISCQIYMMEELPPLSSVDINIKFRDILNKINPDLIVCIFTEEGFPHAVIFEIGFMCGHFGIERTLPRLKFCIHNKIEKIAVMPRYLDYLVARAESYEFYDAVTDRTLYDRIRDIVKGEVLRLYCPGDTEESMTQP